MKKFATIALTAAFLAAPAAGFAASFDGDESVIIFERSHEASYRSDAKDGGVLKALKQHRTDAASRAVDISE